MTISAGYCSLFGGPMFSLFSRGNMIDPNSRDAQFRISGENGAEMGTRHTWAEG